MENVCYIVGAGDNSGTNFTKEENDFVIAADGGFEKIHQLGIEPDLVIGDLDSLGYVPVGDNVEKHKVMKNETDMMICVKTALHKGFNNIVIFGGTGGRIDHTFANIQTLLYASQLGANIKMVDGNNTYTVVSDGSISITGKEKNIFSVFAINGVAHNVTIKNALYNIESYKLEENRPLGVSNQFVNANPVISVGKGSLLIVY